MNERLSIPWELARDVIHGAARMGAPLKPENISDESLCVALGYLIHTGQAAVEAAEVGNRMTKLLARGMGVDPDDIPS